MNQSFLRAPTTKPPLTRARSNTAPSNSISAEDPSKSPRPTIAGRASSYVSPITPKPRTAQTLPHTADKTPRLHLPGATHQHRHGHRHTQSDVHKSQHRNGPEPLPHLTAGLLAEQRRHDADRDKPGHDLWGARANDLKRIATARSHRAGTAGAGDSTIIDGRHDLRALASTDLRVPVKLPRSAIEIALERADVKRRMERAASTQEDVDRMKLDGRRAEGELRDRLAGLGKTSTDITRRLDYTYYSLLEKVGNLVGTIQSFQSLSTQTRALVGNFTKDTDSLDSDIKRRLENFKTGFDEREVRVADLERRGGKARLKAEDLGKRLHNSRLLVESWERRKGEAIKRRGRMWKTTWLTVIGMFGVLVALFMWRQWAYGDVVRASLSVPRGGSSNHSLLVDKEVLRKAKIPEDVQSILQSIKDRRETAHSTWTLPPPDPVITAADDDKRLRALKDL